MDPYSERVVQILDKSYNSYQITELPANIGPLTLYVRKDQARS